jgi:hypothetical protein
MTNEQIKKFLKKSRKGEIKGAEYAYDVLENQGYSGSGSPVIVDPLEIPSYRLRSLAQLSSMDPINLSSMLKDSYMYWGREVIIPGIQPVPTPEKNNAAAESPCPINQFVNRFIGSINFDIDSIPSDIYFSDAYSVITKPLPYLSPLRWIGKTLWSCDPNSLIGFYKHNNVEIHMGFNVPINTDKSDPNSEMELTVHFSFYPECYDLSSDRAYFDIYDCMLTVSFTNFLFNESHYIDWINGWGRLANIKVNSGSFSLDNQSHFQFSNNKIYQSSDKLIVIPAPNAEIKLEDVQFLEVTNFANGEIVPPSEFTTKLNAAFMTAPAAQIYQMVSWTLGSIYGYVKDA